MKYTSIDIPVLGVYKQLMLRIRTQNWKIENATDNASYLEQQKSRIIKPTGPEVEKFRFPEYLTMDDIGPEHSKSNVVLSMRKAANRGRAFLEWKEKQEERDIAAKEKFQKRLEDIKVEEEMLMERFEAARNLIKQEREKREAIIEEVRQLLISLEEESKNWDMKEALLDDKKRRVIFTIIRIKENFKDDKNNCWKGTSKTISDECLGFYTEVDDESVIDNKTMIKRTEEDIVYLEKELKISQQIVRDTPNNQKPKNVLKRDHLRSIESLLYYKRQELLSRKTINSRDIVVKEIKDTIASLTYNFDDIAENFAKYIKYNYLDSLLQPLIKK